MEARQSPLIVGIEDKLPLGQTLIFAFQHLLALTGIWIFPVIIGHAAGMNNTEIGGLVAACFITTGVVTILQSSRVVRLPVVQGPTAAFFVAVLSSVHTVGLGTAFGSMTVAALIFAALAIPYKKLGLLGLLVRYISPPIVFGTLLVIIGAQLAQIGPMGWFGDSGNPADISASAITTLVTFLVVLICMTLGRQTLVKRGALLWGVIVGTAVYAVLGDYHLPALGETRWLAAPRLYPFGFGVSAPVVLMMLLAFLQAGAEAMGMYTLLCQWGNKPLPVHVVNRGLFTEFLGCALGAAAGGLGTTSYPENVGIIRVTRVGSRYVTLTAGILSLALGLIPKVGLLIASLPAPVLAAACTLLFGIIAMSGIGMLSRIEWDDLNIVVAAPAFIISLGTMYLPKKAVALFPEILQGIVTQPMVVGIVMLIVMNVLVNVWIRPMISKNAPALVPANHDF
ncbi:uracil-xanthine permease family protein [Chitinasiproducens palmae]|uniref:Xanthine/uracil permease n=1 Tax=Chitinasiproducens palmae TaxID=1770053 RepID=A0A1H2PKB1_9BURK|nr:solute carrier family 23 protein [Chitinasiproducens palmae]SDV46821.1 Xanthine/uracil permease [Chitinasiproducens palmae]